MDALSSMVQLTNTLAKKDRKESLDPREQALYIILLEYLAEWTKQAKEALSSG